MTKIAAVITAGDARTAEGQARSALSKGADLVELRLDYLVDVSHEVLRNLASAVGKRAIATVRSSAQGGAGRVPDARRAPLLAELARMPFRFLDVEKEADKALIPELRRLSRGKTELIVSQHFPQPVRVPEVADALEACASLGDVAKVAASVDTIEDALALVDLARRHSRGSLRAIVIGMGGLGMVTRALAEDAGQEIQYASVDRPSAPGQLAFATVLRLRGKTPLVVGLAGHPLGHSISPAIHEAAFVAAGVPAVYLPFDVDASSLRVILDAPDRLRLRGFNVTIPHKEAAAELVDELDRDAEALGAVNTVVVADGWTKGHNTDVYGFHRALRSLGLRTGGGSALVLGAGGAAKAVVHVLLQEGAKVAVANRTTSRAQALAASFDEPVEVLEPVDLARGGPWDLLVNATPVGTKGHDGGPPVPDAVIRRSKFLFDLVYNPSETALLAQGRRAGVPGASGLTMLLHQASRAYELWFEAAPDLKAMETAAKEALR